MTRQVPIPNETLLDEVAKSIAQGQSATLRVRGNSMRPFLHGDKDLVRLIPIDRLERYDIVLAKVGNQYLLHRIVTIEGNQVTLMGDGNIRKKEYCTLQDIMAKATHRIRKNKEQPFPQFLPKIWIFLLPFRRILLHLF